MNNFMGSLGRNQVETNLISENNAIRYKINAGGATKHSTFGGYLYFQNNPIGKQINVGINVRVFNNNNLIGDVYYSLVNQESIKNFIDYVNNIKPTDFCIMISGINLQTNATLDSWFKSIGSVVWSDVINILDTAYVSVYNGMDKKITKEAIYYDDGSEGGLAELELVYDSIYDIGTTGYSNKVVYDLDEYSTTDSYEYKRYPDNTAISKLSDYSLKPSEFVFINGELYTDKKLSDNNMDTRISVRWYNGTSLITSDNVDNKEYNKWNKFVINKKIPINCDGFKLVVQRFPKNDTVIGKSGVRNLIISRTSTDTMISKLPSGFGVNGIKTSDFIDGTEYPLIMNLPDAQTKDNIVPINEVREHKFFNNEFLDYIDLRFTDSNRFNNIIVNRDSNATYFNQSGLVKSSYANYRLDYRNVDGYSKQKGLLIENQSTNLIKYCDDLTKWTKVGNVTTTKVGKFNDFDINRITGNSATPPNEGYLSNKVTIKNPCVTLVAKKGTSNNISIVLSLYDGANVYKSTAFGNFDSITSTTMSIEKEYINDVCIFKLKPIINQKFNSMDISIGCLASKAGEYIDVIAVQAEENNHSSIIYTTNKEETRLKDEVIFPPANTSVLFEWVDYNTNEVVRDIQDAKGVYKLPTKFKSGWLQKVGIYKTTLDLNTKNKIINSTKYE